MSLRYVWERSSVAEEITKEVDVPCTGSARAYNIIALEPSDVFWKYTYSNKEFRLSQALTVEIGDSYKFSNGVFSVYGSSETIDFASGDTTADNTSMNYNMPWTKYIVFGTSSQRTKCWKLTADDGRGTLANIRLVVTGNSASDAETWLGVYFTSPPGSRVNSCSGAKIETVKDALQGSVSNASSGAYPPRNNHIAIDIICAILLLKLRGCYRG